MTILEYVFLKFEINFEVSTKVFDDDSCCNIYSAVSTVIKNISGENGFSKYINHKI